MNLSITQEGGVAVVTIDNPPVNALSQKLRQNLHDAVEALEKEDDVRAVVLICAGRTFIAGADVSEFGAPPQPPHLPDVVAKIEAASKPWIAAIHGSALGGGLEVALGCRFRVAVATAQLGLPEVTLGVIPGAGGTVRLPRLIDLARAVEMVTGGRPIPAREAQGIGLIDAVVDGDLHDGAIRFAHSALAAPLPEPICNRPAPQPDRGFWDKAEADVAAKARRQEAPLRAVHALRHGVEHGFEAGIERERETFLDLRGSDQAAALRHVFFAERAATRPPELKGITPRDIARTAVIGGGTMGAGIAAALRDANLPVILLERDEAACDRGRDTLRSIFDGAAKRGRLTPEQAAERVAGVTFTTDHARLADVDLAIEAVFEDLEVKRAVFRRLGEICRPDAILATNTSYLDPRAIGESLPQPERFLGLHFFSPAQVMKLLEIVPTGRTAPDVVATGFALAQRLRKIPVRAGICDGFIGNRILKMTRMQAERVLLAGATPAQVDATMRDFGLPMGPFEAQDLGGLDIAAFQRKAAVARGEVPFAPVAERLCALGRLGQKTGAGWYDYAAGDRRPQPSATVAAIIAELAGPGARDWTAQAIADCLLLPMVNEAAAIREEGVALRAADIDLVKVHGYGFPRWRGGPMHYAERRGLAEVAETLRKLAQAGLAEAPHPRLERAARSGAWEN